MIYNLVAQWCICLFLRENPDTNIPTALVLSLKSLCPLLSILFSFETDHKDQYQLQKVAINIKHKLQNTFFLCWGLVLMSRVIHFRQWKIFFDLHHFILWLYYLQCIRMNIRNLVKFCKVYVPNRFCRF